MNYTTTGYGVAAAQDNRIMPITLALYPKGHASREGRGNKGTPQQAVRNRWIEAMCYVTRIIKKSRNWYVLQVNTTDSVMYVIVNNIIKMHNSIYDYEKGKLVEKSGRKTTNLRLPHRERYGSRVAMEKGIFIYAGPPGTNHPVRRVS